MRGLNHKELTAFCSQLAMILKAGISAVEGLSILREDDPQGEGRRILDMLYEHMEETGTLYLAMRESGVFPDYVCNMTEIGEQTGRLDEVMEGLADHYERAENLSSGIRSALTYPLIMVGMMAAVILLLMTKVMPVFYRVFEDLGGSAGGLSGGILNLGMVMSRYSALLAVVMVLILGAAGFLAFTQKGRNIAAGWMEHWRPTQKILRKMACAQAAGGMDLCIRSGLDLDQSLEMVQRLVEHRKVKEQIGICREKMQEGETFESALAESQVFSGVYAKMVSIGIRTGAVDQVMGKIARQYEDEVSDRVQSAILAVEPTLVAVFSCLVGLILLSVILPLMSIMTNIG